MPSSDVLSLLLIAVACFAASGAVAASGLSKGLKAALIAGLALRLVGAVVRYQVLFFGYDGTGDAVAYYDRSLDYAAQILSKDFSWVFDPTQWYQTTTTWWGTQFVHVPAAFTIAAIGPTLLGVFMVFSLASFLGLLGFLVAFRNSFPERSGDQYAAFLFLFPSLWFWPASLGKEALVLCGLGLAVAGYVGRSGRPWWPLLAGGMALVFAVRPQVAGVAAICMVLAEVIGGSPFRSFGTALRTVVLLGLGASLLFVSMRELGVGDYALTELDSYIEDSSSRRASGDTDVGAVNVSVSGAPLAIANVLLRPFVWESSSPFVLAAAVEIVVLWGLLFSFRARLVETVKAWRDKRLVRLSVIFILLYSLALGLMVINVGIIARQRVFLIPFLFVLIGEPYLRSRFPSAAASRRAQGILRRRATPGLRPEVVSRS